MAHNVISTCPVCSGDLSVTRLQCRNCGTAIEGDFNVGRFGRLTREQLGLLESFLRARGNLKELERELKLSYPTVRARVDSLVRSLGLGEPTGEVADGDLGDFGSFGAFGGTSDEPFGDGAEQTAGSGNQKADEARRQILERLARREISADEAAASIRALGREK